jgi:hypothetical protein
VPRLMKRFSSLGTLFASVLLVTIACSAKPQSDAIQSSKIPIVDREIRAKWHLPKVPENKPMARAVRDLSEFVMLQQRHFPGAVVTSGFYDWRTTSRYRSHAGLHFGYDIAMPYGCPFSAGWPGRVVAIAVWSGEEHGITVDLGDGSTVTYGHVAPRVSVGQMIHTGDVLGTIARDHVDVKMRDAAGNYFDFGGSARVVAAPSWAGGSWMTPKPSRETLLAEWLVASNAVDLAQEELQQLETQIVLKRSETEQLKRRIPALQKSVDLMSEYLEQGLVSRVTAEENRAELEKAKSRLKDLSKNSAQGSKTLQPFQQNLKSAKDRLAQASKLASQQGLSWKQVEAFVESHINNNASLKRNVEAYKKVATQKNAARLSQLNQKMQQSDSELKSLEELYEIGGVARNDVENARNKNQILHRELNALQGKTTPDAHSFKLPAKPQAKDKNASH